MKKRLPPQVSQLPQSMSMTTNECYIMNMWFQNNFFDYMVDGAVRKWIKALWNEDWDNYGKGRMTRDYHIKVTFEVVENKRLPDTIQKEST